MRPGPHIIGADLYQHDVLVGDAQVLPPDVLSDLVRQRGHANDLHKRDSPCDCAGDTCIYEGSYLHVVPIFQTCTSCTRVLATAQVKVTKEP